MATTHYPTLLSKLVREGRFTIDETCEQYERKARDMAENATLSRRQLLRWMEGDVGRPRPVARRVAEAFWGYGFDVLLGPPDHPRVMPPGPTRETSASRIHVVPMPLVMLDEIVTAYRDALVTSTLDDMRRRDLLALGAFAPALPLFAGTAEPARVGASEIEAIRHTATNLDMATRYTVSVGQHAVRQAASMLGAGVAPGRERDLQVAVSFLATEVGWGELENGIDPAATLRFAARVAHDSGDRDLEALALVNTAVAVAPRDAALAASTAEHATEVAASGADRAHAHAVASRLALAPKAAIRHLAIALDTSPVAGESVTAAQMTGWEVKATIAYAAFVAEDRAYEFLTDALDSIDTRARCTRARCHVQLGVLALRDHDGGAAEDHLRAALTAPRSRAVVGALDAFAAQAHATGQRELARLARAA